MDGYDLIMLCGPETQQLPFILQQQLQQLFNICWPLRTMKILLNISILLFATVTTFSQNQTEQKPITMDQFFRLA